LVYWSLRVTKVARDNFQVLVAVGVAATVFWQFFVNVGMVTGLLPVVGVALPLLSYGGSSVITICIGMGLLFNIAFRKRAT
jgi:rod shape determining protein RodA